MRITARGTGLLAGAVALLAVGFAVGYPELAVLGSAAAVALVTAVLYALWQPRLASTRTVEPDRVSRGEVSVVTLTVHNRDRLRSADLVAEDRCAGLAVPVPLIRLRPGRDTTVSYPVPTRRRGVVPVGPLRLTRVDPLGLVRLVRRHPGTAQVWVHPRIHPMSAVAAGAARSMDGRFDRVPNGSITFDSLRAYVPGDELRRVHWRTSARVGELMVREHVDTSLPRIVLLLDNRRVAHPRVVDGVADTFESACEAAASVVAAAAREDLPLTLLLVDDGPGDTDGPGGGNHIRPGGDRIGPHRGSGGSPDQLDRLAAAGLGAPSCGDDPLRTAVARLRRRRLGDTLVFLTGPGTVELGHVAALRGCYPQVVAGVFGVPDDRQARERHGYGQLAGVVVISAADGAEFAAEFGGLSRW